MVAEAFKLILAHFALSVFSKTVNPLLKQKKHQMSDETPMRFMVINA